jgi:hypothetical protein
MFEPLSSTKTNCSGSSWVTAVRQAVRASSSRSLAASAFFYGSSPGDGSPATSSLHSAVGRSAPPTRRSAPRRLHQGMPEAVPVRSPPGPSQCAVDSRGWVCAPATPSPALAPPPVSRWSPRRQSGERLLAWADPQPPLVPVVLSGRSNTLAYQRLLQNLCLPSPLASCFRRRASCSSVSGMPSPRHGRMRSATATSPTCAPHAARRPSLGRGASPRTCAMPWGLAVCQRRHCTRPWRSAVASRSSSLTT